MSEKQTLGADLMPRHNDTERVIEDKMRKMIKTIADSMEKLERPQSQFMLVIGFDAENHYSSVIAHYVLMHKMLPKLPGIAADHKLTLADTDEWKPGVMVIDQDNITPALSIRCKLATEAQGDKYSQFIRDQALDVCNQAKAALSSGNIPAEVEAAINVTGSTEKTTH